MAENNLTAILPKLLAQGLLTLRQRAIMPRLVNRSYDLRPGTKGSTVDVPIPSAITAVAVTPAATPPSTEGITPTSVAITCDQHFEAPFQLSDTDLEKCMDGVIPMQAAEAIKALANNVDSAILSLYKKVYSCAGTPGVTPFGSDLSAFLAANQILDDQLADTDPRMCVINAAAKANALGLRALQDASYRGTTDGIVRGLIGEVLGASWYMDQNVLLHTKGAATAGTIALDASTLRPVGTKTLHIDGFSTKPSGGDLFTIAGDSQTYVVTGATDLSGTDCDVSFEPGLRIGIPAVDGNEVVTFINSHRANLMMHRDAFAFANRPMETSAALGLGHFMSAVDEVSGLVLRLEISREFKRTRFSYDILYGVQAVRPELAVRILG